MKVQWRGMTWEEREKEFVERWEEISGEINKMAQEKGFWGDGIHRNKGEMIALMHSELSEALEAVRSGNPQSEKIPDFSNLEEELADCVIRIMDMGTGFGLRLPEAILAKMKYNDQRPHKHGREF